MIFLRRAGIALAAFLLALLLVLTVVPLLIPLPPLEGTRPVEELADPDSLFVDINHIDVHVKKMGEGQPVFILLHGFGSSLFSWRAVMEPLSTVGTVIAYDRPAFGLTERPMPGSWRGESPYAMNAQLDLLDELIDRFGQGQRVVLVGNSAGGTVAAAFTLAHPERVRALILVDPALSSEAGPASFLRFLYNTPQAERLGLLGVRSIQNRGMELINLAWHDPQKITQEILDDYRKPLQAPDWDRALWEFTKAASVTGLRDRVGEVNLPGLVVTGEDDRIMPM
ncbi:alpha/beta hydrolase, partial [bacterium]|nr:alpha/beta hydrolase [bacterium]